MSPGTSSRARVVVLDLGEVLLRWDPFPAVAAGVGEEQAEAFLAGSDFDFATFNHDLDSGRDFAEALAEVEREQPRWAPHVRAYRENFRLSLVGTIEENVAVLRDLAAGGVPVFALTNWAAGTFGAAVERFDFLALFDDIVVSGDEKVAKPDPAIYAVLRRRVGRPLPECVFADDKEANVAAATAVGMDAFVFGPGVDLRAELVARGVPLPA